MFQCIKLTGYYFFTQPHLCWCSVICWYQTQGGRKADLYHTPSPSVNTDRGCEALSEVLPVFWPLLSLRIPHAEWRWMMGEGRFSVHRGDICIVCRFIKSEPRSSSWMETDWTTVQQQHMHVNTLCISCWGLHLPHSLYIIQGGMLPGEKCSHAHSDQIIIKWPNKHFIEEPEIRLWTDGGLLPILHHLHLKHLLYPVIP